MPVLDKAGIRYYNPQVDDWSPDLVAVEAQAKEDASVLLFVIDDQTRALASVAESIEYICSGRHCVLVVRLIAMTSVINGIKVSDDERKDLNRSRMYLQDIANRRGVPCFSDTREALQFICDSSDDTPQTRHRKMSLQGRGSVGYLDSPVQMAGKKKLGAIQAGPQRDKAASAIRGTGTTTADGNSPRPGTSSKAQVTRRSVEIKDTEVQTFSYPKLGTQTQLSGNTKSHEFNRVVPTQAITEEGAGGCNGGNTPLETQVDANPSLVSD